MEQLIFKSTLKNWSRQLMLSISGIIVGLIMLFYLPLILPINEWFIWIPGFILLGYCVTLIFMIRNATSSKYKGLIFSRNGVEEDAGLLSVGEVSWDSIQAIEIEENKKYPRLVLKLKNSKNWISNSPNNAVKRLRENNQTNFGSPIVIETERYKVDVDLLEKFLADRKTTVTFKTFV